MIDRATCEAIRKEAQVALEAIFKRHNISCGSVNARYGEEIRLSIRGTCPSPTNAQGETPEAAAYRAMAGYEGLDPRAVEAEITFIYANTAYRVMGWNPRARQNKLLMKRVDTGKVYVIAPHIVSRPINEATQNKLGPAPEGSIVDLYKAHTGVHALCP